MTTAYWSLAGADLVQDWTDIGQITADNNWNGVASIVGYRGDDLTTVTGTDPRTITTSSSVVNVIANQTSTALNTGGVAEFQITNPTVALQGSGTADAPYLSLYLDATGRDNVTVSVNLRDIDGTADNAVQPIAVQYRLGDGAAWTNVTGGYVADATAGPSSATLVTPLSVTLPSDANNAANLQVRLMTTNAVGNDEWVGLDDIRVTSTAHTSNVPGALNIADASLTEGNSGTQAFVFTVSRIGGADGAVDATYTVQLPGGAGGADAGDFAAFSQTGVVHFADGASRATITLPLTGDTAPEPNERFSITLSNATGGATIDRATATGTIVNDDILPLKIGAIQGEGHMSSYVGQTVVTDGIVTGVDSNGFYLQDFGDGNDRTSDGIFVFTSTAPNDVYVGDHLDVQGTVSEFRSGTGGLTITEIVAPSLSLESWGNALPDAVLIGTGGRMPPTQQIDDDGLTSYDPNSDGLDFWESLEGMRVTLDRPQVVSNTTSDTFLETDVVVSGGAGATGINSRGGITLSGNDNNPEKIQIDGHDALFSGFDPHYSIGDQLSNVSGIVNYSASEYEVLVTDPVAVTRDVTIQREISGLVGDATHLSVASYNVENLDASDGKFGTLASDIVNNLRSPDIIALEEVQDGDGAGNGANLSGQPTAQGLINAINAISGAHYAYVEIAPTTANSTGGEPNGNIRNGYLYNLDRVDYVDGSAALIAGDAYNNSRKPLVADFTFNGEKITLVNVHATSRLGSDPAEGATQPPVNAGDASRTAQAAGVKAYVNTILGADQDHNIVVLGDWNGFYYEQAQTQLTSAAQGGVLTNLNSLLPSQERYSYMFDGNAQQIDNVLVTAGLLVGAQYDSVHINAEFDSIARPTDHDPQLALFQILLNSPATAVGSMNFAAYSEPRPEIMRGYDAAPVDALAFA